MDAIAETHTVHDLADRYSGAWNARDLDAIMSLHADDSIFQLHVAGGDAVSGATAVRETFAAFLAQFPDARFAPKRMRVGPDHWVSESMLTATTAHAVELGGERVEDAGTRIEVACVDIVEVRGGRVARKDTYLDATNLSRPTGAS
jgi:steroid delta-isomerase-like uncharacterized protein